MELLVRILTFYALYAVVVAFGFGIFLGVAFLVLEIRRGRKQVPLPLPRRGPGLG